MGKLKGYQYDIDWALSHPTQFPKNRLFEVTIDYGTERIPISITSDNPARVLDMAVSAVLKLANMPETKHGLLKSKNLDTWRVTERLSNVSWETAERYNLPYIKAAMLWQQALKTAAEFGSSDNYTLVTFLFTHAVSEPREQQTPKSPTGISRNLDLNLNINSIGTERCTA